MTSTDQAHDVTLDLLLWSIIDEGARPWARRRAMRLLGSKAACDAEMTARAALDQALLEWGSAPFRPTASATASPGVRAPAWGRLSTYPLQFIIAPAAALGLGIMAAAIRFGLDGLYAIVAQLVERLL